MRLLLISDSETICTFKCCFLFHRSVKDFSVFSIFSKGDLGVSLERFYNHSGQCILTRPLWAPAGFISKYFTRIGRNKITFYHWHILSFRQILCGHLQCTSCVPDLSKLKKRYKGGRGQFTPPPLHTQTQTLDAQTYKSFFTRKFCINGLYCISLVNTVQPFFKKIVIFNLVDRAFSPINCIIPSYQFNN